MAFSDTDVKSTSAGGGTDYTIPFQIIVDASSEVLVYERDESTDPPSISLKTEGAMQDYTLTGAPTINDFPTTVTFNSATAATSKIIIVRQLPLTQTLDLITNGQVNVSGLETALDRIVAMVQQLNEKLSRAALLGITEQEAQITLPEPESNKIPGWNSDGDDLENKSAADILNLDDALAVSNNLSDVADAAESRSNLGLGHLVTESASFTINDSEGSWTNITGWTLDSAGYTSGVYEIEVVRGTSYFSNQQVALQYLNGAWRIQLGMGIGDSHGLSFNVSESGGVAQVQYQSDNKGAGTLKFIAVRFSA